MSQSDAAAPTQNMTELDLAELRRRFPQPWRAVGDTVVDATGGFVCQAYEGRPELIAAAVNAYAEQASPAVAAAVDAVATAIADTYGRDEGTEPTARAALQALLAVGWQPTTEPALDWGVDWGPDDGINGGIEDCDGESDARRVAASPAAVYAKATVMCRNVGPWRPAPNPSAPATEAQPAEQAS
jgi:hypothetical protein